MQKAPERVKFILLFKRNYSAFNFCMQGGFIPQKYTHYPQPGLHTSLDNFWCCK